MIEILFHAGTEHPSLIWVVIPSILSFIAGLAIGRFAKLRRGTTTPSNASHD